MQWAYLFSLRHQQSFNIAVYVQTNTTLASSLTLTYPNFFVQTSLFGSEVLNLAKFMTLTFVGRKKFISETGLK